MQACDEWCSSGERPRPHSLLLHDLEACLPDCAISKLFADDFKSYVPVSNVSAIDDFNNLLE